MLSIFALIISTFLFFLTRDNMYYTFGLVSIISGLSFWYLDYKDYLKKNNLEILVQSGEFSPNKDDSKYF